MQILCFIRRQQENSILVAKMAQMVWLGHLLTLTLAAAQPVLKRDELNLKTLNCTCNGTGQSSEKMYYRYLQPSRKDPSKLYVGAMNYLFKLNIGDLTCERCKRFSASAEDFRKCELQGKTANPDCQNHIRVAMEIKDQLEICGTAAYAPTVYTLDRDLNTTQATTKKIGFCPFDPFDNYTAIVITEGNPGNATVPYFGTYTDFIKNYPSYYRPSFQAEQQSYSEITTDQEDISWLNYPQFVGSFDNKDSLLFFFRETALEYRQTSKNKIYSRVGKVCKFDKGSGFMPKKNWLSFQKARLICSLPGQSPYYFDDIYDVFESGDRFFALFYKQGADLGTSAICVYDRQDIKKVLKGKFQRRTNYGTWETVPDSENPNPRLDNCTAHELTPGVFDGKTSTFQLMDQSVDPVHGCPIFYKSGIQLNNIVAGETQVDLAHGNATNIYATTTRGEIYNIFLKEFAAEKFLAELIAVYRPFSTSQVIWDMKILNQSLYFGTDKEVSSLNLTEVCSNTNYIDLCVTNTLCKWQICNDACVAIGEENCTDEKQMKNWTSITQQGILHSVQDLVNASETNSLSAISGLYLTVPLKTKCKVQEVVWIKAESSGQACFEKVNVLEDSDRFAATAFGDLIIKNVTMEDKGIYTACDQRDLRLPLTCVSVEPAENNTTSIVEVWKQQFNEWATAFKKWKSCAAPYLEQSCEANNG